MREIFIIVYKILFLTPENVHLTTDALVQARRLLLDTSQRDLISIDYKVYFIYLGPSSKQYLFLGSYVVNANKNAR